MQVGNTGTPMNPIETPLGEWSSELRGTHQKRSVLRRCHQFLYGLENMVAAVTVEGVVFTRVCKPIEGGVVLLNYEIRPWAPAFWIGWLRVVIFRDRCGAVYYQPWRPK